MSDKKDIETIRAEEILPDYDSLFAWEYYPAQLMVEYTQSIEEGKDLEKLKPLFNAIYALPRSKQQEKLADTLFTMVQNAPQVEGYAYTEPSGLDAIKALRKIGTSLPPVDKDKLSEKIKGAWLGRICGCLLGKCVEGIRLDELNRLLRETGNFPLSRYIWRADISSEAAKTYRFSFEGRCFSDTVACAPVDDDTNYTVLGAQLIEKYGRDFTPSDVGKIWLDLQPKNAYCTAERVAFINLVNGYKPPMSALYKNPYREWIGAQIRADYFGYINPGNPEMAAEMAWRDASISHIKNGIYGEMFAAAMIAGATVLDEMTAVIECGLSQIPTSSRLHGQVSELLADYRNGIDCEAYFTKIQTRYHDTDQHDWCHTISNALIVAGALLYGGGDFGKSICLAVQAGFDTDCNGATVGSIVGILNGAGAIPAAWTEPLKGQLDTSIFGVGRVVIDDMVRTTLKHIAM